MAAGWRYARNVRFPWAPVLFAAATAFVFAFVGATAVSLLPRDAVRPLILVLLVAMLVYTLVKKDFGALHRPRSVGRRELALALAMGAAIGFYDGLFGPGTGSFLIFLFIRFFGLDFLRASAASKIVNIATNLAALSFFVPSGHVLLAFAVPMAVANVGGAFAGTRLALRGGTPVIRRLFVLLVVVLIAKMAWDTAAGRAQRRGAPDSTNRRNSARVRASSRKLPSIREVTMLTPRLCTPRLVMHSWAPSTTTPTPSGASARSMQPAICAVIFSCTWKRLA